jgi:hypothetical protein
MEISVMMASDRFNERRRTSSPHDPTAFEGELKPLEIARQTWNLPPIAPRHVTQGFLLAVILSVSTIIVLGILSNNAIISQHTLNQILGIALACLATILLS